MPAPAFPLELDSTAFHEAAHCVICWQAGCGLEVYSVTIRPDAEFLGMCWTRCQSERRDRSYYLQHAAIDLAGPIADLIFEGEDLDGELPESTDMDHARQHLRLARYPERDIEGVLANLRQQVTAVLLRDRDKVERLAAWLLDCETIVGVERIRKIIEGR